MTFNEMREENARLRAHCDTINTILWLVVQHHGGTVNTGGRPIVSGLGQNDCALVVPKPILPKDTIAKCNLENTKDGLKITACKIV